MEKVINTLTQENIRFTLFPDNQPHVDLQNINEGDDVNVCIRLASSNDMLHLLQIAGALDDLGAIKKTLIISYLMGARYDRSMRKGDSRDLKIFSGLINGCEFPKVKLFDVHSDTALQLIENSVNITNEELVKAYTKPNAVLIIPDAGAVKKVDKYVLWNPNIKDVVYCVKNRNLNSGSLTLQVLDSDDICFDRDCVIIDDLCDGGATFLAIAEQIVRPKSLTLIVSHGVFSKGLRQLKEKFDEIITTDSFKFQNPEPKLRVINLFA